MYIVFALLAVVSSLCILLGLIKPALVLRWGQKRTRLRAVGWYWLFTVVFAILAGATGPKPNHQAKADVSQPQSVAATPTQAASAPVEAKQVTQATAPVAENKPVKVEKEKAAPQYKIGSEVEVGDFTYKVNSVKYAKRVGNSIVNEKADGVFLIINVTARNNDKETHSINSSRFTVKDSEGTSFDYSNRADTAFMMSGGKNFFLKQCQPKIPTKGTLIFEVPQQGVYTLCISPGVFSSPTDVVLQ